MLTRRGDAGPVRRRDVRSRPSGTRQRWFPITPVSLGQGTRPRQGYVVRGPCLYSLSGLREFYEYLISPFVR